MGIIFKEDNDKSAHKGAAFLFGIAGISALSGFGYAIGNAKKADPTMFDKGFVKAKDLNTAGSVLALRALGWGTLFAVSGFTVFCCFMWKLSGAKNMQEFRTSVGRVLPRIPRNDPPQGRTEFNSLSDLLQYIIDEDVRGKKEGSDD